MITMTIVIILWRAREDGHIEHITGQPTKLPEAWTITPKFRVMTHFQIPQQHPHHKYLLWNGVR